MWQTYSSQSPLFSNKPCIIMSSSRSSTTDSNKSAGPSRLWKKIFAKSIPFKRNNTSENTLVSSMPQSLPIFIPSPPPAVHHIIPNNNALDAFFGAHPNQSSLPTTARASSPTFTLQPPPYSPYGHDDVLQATTSDVYAAQEPPTLARFLFLYGFVFFPFWILGILVLVSPLRPTPDWEEGKTEHEKEQLLVVIRTTEKKWARRCLYAFSLFAITIILIAIIIRFFAIHKSP